MPLQATSGAASYDAFGGGAAAVPQYIEDVFSTWLYQGTSANQTITNGIDLSTKGGLVWCKGRPNAGYSHRLFDTARGVNNSLSTNLTNAQATQANSVTAFNTTGFSLGSDGNGEVNFSGSTYVAWTFRKQPKFFDVLTYSGTGSAQNIAHSLGSAPGCVIVKQTNAGNTNWRVWHRSGTQLASHTALLNTTDSYDNTGSAVWGPTASSVPNMNANTFSIGSVLSASGGTYVAYIFAHNAGGFGLTGTDNVISCGSFNVPSFTDIPVTVGFEPQYLLLKSVSTDRWRLLDISRGMPWPPSNSSMLYPNQSDSEDSSAGNLAYPTPTGFIWKGSTGLGAISDYIYIAIRRGPMKTPTTGTSVLNLVARAGTSAIATVSGLTSTPDLVVSKVRNIAAGGAGWYDRLRGTNLELQSSNTNNEANGSGSASWNSVAAFNNNSLTLGADQLTGSINFSTFNYVNWIFSRAPGFFDEVCYTGTGANRTVAHNLGVAPELMIVKTRNASDYPWMCYHIGLNNGVTPQNWWITLNTTNPNFDTGSPWNGTAPTSSVFSLGVSSNTNRNDGTLIGQYVAYLFASCPGVSKVGSYTGNGSSQTINCGFTGGARFVMIKRTNSDGDWYVWDTARGIVAGNDPHLSLNTIAADVTSNDTIDTDSTGFVVNQVAATNVNVNAATYIFLAIA